MVDEPVLWLITILPHAGVDDHTHAQGATLSLRGRGAFGLPGGARADADRPGVSLGRTLHEMSEGARRLMP